MEQDNRINDSFFQKDIKLRFVQSTLFNTDRVIVEGAMWKMQI